MARLLILYNAESTADLSVAKFLTRIGWLKFINLVHWLSLNATVKTRLAGLIFFCEKLL